MRSLESCISKIDIFGTSLTLLACQKQKFTSSFGGILTLVVVGFTILLSIKSTVDCVTRTNATITDQIKTLTDPGGFGLNSSNFNFAIGYDNNEFPLSASIFGFQMLLITQIRMSNGSVVTNTTMVPLVTCTLDYWEGYETEFTLYGLSNYLCPSIPAYPITGTSTSQTFQIIRLQVTNCVNGTGSSDVVCAPQAVITQTISTNPPQINLFYTNNDFSFDNYSTPVERYVSYSTFSSAPGLFTKSIQVALSQQYIITDGNLLMSYNPSQNVTFLINGELNDIAGPTTMGGQAIYMNIDFVLSPEIIITSRVFSKIDSILSTVGGVASSLIGVLAIFANIYNSYSMNVQIANTLYEFETKKTSPKNKAKPRSCCRKRQRHLNEDELSSGRKTKDANCSQVTIFANDSKKTTSVQTDNQMQPFVEGFRKYEKNFGKTLPYSFWLYIQKAMTCGRRKTDRLMAQATQRMQKEIDLTYILKKLGEIDKLKEILFNEDQIEVFCYSQAPKIKEEEEKVEDNKNKALNSKAKTPKPEQKKNLGDIKTLRRFAMLFKSYRKLLSQRRNSLNMKLINLIGTDMQDILYDLDYKLKVDQGLRKAFYSEFSLRAFQEIQARRSSQNLTRAKAVKVIEKRAKAFLNRRAKLKAANNQVSIDSANILTEKRNSEDDFIDPLISIQNPKNMAISPNKIAEL